MALSKLTLSEYAIRKTNVTALNCTRVRDSSGKPGARHERGLATDSPTPKQSRRQNPYKLNQLKTFFCHGMLRGHAHNENNLTPELRENKT